MKDEINDRMKDFYENRTRYYLPRRTFTVIRIDGKSFHTYTRGLNRPFDQGLIDDMDATTKFLCESIQGARFAYVQSDEISILLTDFEKNTTDAWFDGNIQKMCSISASMTTAKFNELRIARYMNEIHFNSESNVKRTSAFFDSRVFTIPLEDEVINYFIARQQDATRNSISAVAQSMYSAKELHGKTTDNMQELIFEKGQNWNDFPVGQKRGRAVAKRTKLVEVKGEAYHKSKDKSAFIINETGIFVERNAWTVLDPPIFTGDKSFIRNEIYGAKLREV
jgi:tRNA(His) 5'-end guanylyltransferase